MKAGRQTTAAKGGPPLVSVIVPAWNAESTLSQTLHSVAAQSYPNLEIVIVDDGSTDRTWAIATDFCTAETRARVIRTRNSGPSAARNRGIDESKGEWIAPIDADDLWHPTKIEKQLAVAVGANERPGFVYCWFRRVDIDDVIIASGPRVSLNGSVFGELCYFNPVGNGSALLISREAIEGMGGYDESFRSCEDLMVQLRIAACKPVANVPEHLVGWREHPNNASADVKYLNRSCELVYREFRAEGVPVPTCVRRWVAADGNFYAAEQEALAGRLGSAVWQLALAIARDPLRTSLLGTYRSLRYARRRLGPRKTAIKSVTFYEADPTAPLCIDPYEIGPFLRVINRLVDSRVRGLSATGAAAEL